MADLDDIEPALQRLHKLIQSAEVPGADVDAAAAACMLRGSVPVCPSDTGTLATHDGNPTIRTC